MILNLLVENGRFYHYIDSSTKSKESKYIINLNIITDNHFMMSPNWMKKQNLSKHRLAKNSAISSITLTKKLRPNLAERAGVQGYADQLRAVVSRCDHHGECGQYPCQPLEEKAEREFPVSYDPENNRHCLLLFGYRCVKQIIQTPSGKCNPLSLHAQK